MNTRLAGAVPSRLAEPGWWRRPFRMMQTNLRLIDADLPVDRVAEFVAGHGADAWLVNTGGIYASYPSRLASQTPNPYLNRRPSGDIVADALQAAHERGLKLLARMDFSKVLPHVADAHPDWLYVSSKGERQVFNELVTTCPSAGYFQEEAFAILDEVLDHYPVDGFFINWFMYSEMNYAHQYLGPCHCDRCVRLWRNATGRRLPQGPESSDYPRWKAWSRQNILDVGGRLRDGVAERRVDAPLILHDTADMRYVEANNAVGREFWPYQTAESVSAAFTRAPGTPVLVNCVTFLDFPYRMAAEDPERLAQYLIQAMSRGASISTYIMGHPGAITYGSLDLAGEIMRFHRNHDDLYAELSSSTRVLLVSPGEHMERGTPPAQVAEFRGLHAALTELHVPFDVVEAEQLDALPPAQLARYCTIVLPNADALDSDAATTVDAWVDGGGTLLATLSRPAPPFTVPRSLGVTAVRSTDADSALLSAYAEDQDGHVVPLYGTAHRVETAAKARTIARLVPTARFGPPEYCYGHTASDDPALVEHQWGRGRAVTCTWSIGRAYHDLELVDLRNVIAVSLRHLADDLVIETTLPSCVEIVLGRANGRQVIHLINHSGARRHGYSEPVPVRDTSLRIRARANGRVRALVCRDDLVARADGPDQVIDLPTIGRFEVLVIDEAP